MSIFLIEFVKYFMSAKLREEIEDEIEADREFVFSIERKIRNKQISKAWVDQGKIFRMIDTRPTVTKF
jgi:hypothetical protein